MTEPTHAGSALVLQSANPATALDALSEYEKVAAERRAHAEHVLAQARELEARLSAVRQTMDPLAAAAATARARELEADERTRVAQERFAHAKADLEAERALLVEVRAARQRAEADVAEVYAQVDALSKTNGLTAEAAKRIVERRMADSLRRATNRTA